MHELKGPPKKLKWQPAVGWGLARTQRSWRSNFDVHFLLDGGTPLSWKSLYAGPRQIGETHWQLTSWGMSTPYRGQA